MPLFYQHNINDATKLAVWHIAEEEPFFLEKVAIQKEITHPHKRLQHLAGRYLLQILDPLFPLHLIEIAASRKPLLSNGKYHFSISHCGDYAAAIISKDSLAGIDVELVTPKIELVKTRFLREDELEIIAKTGSGFTATNTDPETAGNELLRLDRKLLTLFWSTKEALFKWYGKGALSFKNNMHLRELLFENNKGFIKADFKKDKTVCLKAEFRIFGNLCLVWVVG